jgi:hypothetical protein
VADSPVRIWDAWFTPQGGTRVQWVSQGSYTGQPTDVPDGTSYAVEFNVTSVVNAWPGYVDLTVPGETPVASPDFSFGTVYPGQVSATRSFTRSQAPAKFQLWPTHKPTDPSFYTVGTMRELAVFASVASVATRMWVVVRRPGGTSNVTSLAPGESVVVLGRLETTSGAAVAAQRVAISGGGFGGLPASVTTDAGGYFSLPATAPASAGSYTVAASFSGATVAGVGAFAPSSAVAGARRTVPMRVV